MNFTGQLYINKKDAWLTWGAFLVSDSLDNLMLPASPKAYTQNDFRSQDGKQIFVINPKKAAREVQIEFCILADSREKYLTAYKSLVSELNNGMIEISIPSIDMRFEVIVSAYLSLGYYGKFGKLSARLLEPYSAPPVLVAVTTESMDIILTEDGQAIII